MGLPWNLVDQTSSCWTWRGATIKGYGKYGGRVIHKQFFEALVGPVPADLELDHVCRNKLCVRPDHLEPVTHAENMRRRNAVYTRCRHGHEFTTENTCLDRRGRRSCRTCRNDSKRRRYAERAA